MAPCRTGWSTHPLLPVLAANQCVRTHTHQLSKIPPISTPKSLSITSPLWNTRPFSQFSRFSALSEILYIADHSNYLFKSLSIFHFKPASSFTSELYLLCVAPFLILSICTSSLFSQTLFQKWSKRATPAQILSALKSRFLSAYKTSPVGYSTHLH